MIPIPNEVKKAPNFVPRFISPAHAEQWWVLKARENPLYFIWYLTELQPARHHEIWMKQMWRSPEDLERLGPLPLRLNIIGPRFSAKTLIMTYTIAWYMATNPLDTFGIIAVSSTIARDRLSMLRQLFTENERFKNVFPHIEVDKKRPDTQDEFTIWSTRGPTGRRLDYKTWRSYMTRSGSQLNKNPSIFATGNGGKGVIGRRISGILLLDDMVDETFLSPEAQNKMMRYIAQTLNPCITEEGRIWNIGTRWMLDDIYEQLEKNPMWLTITIPAILYDGEGNAMSYWPQFWPLSRLENERLTMNDDILFRIMFLCDPSAVSASLFRRENLHKGLPEALPDFAQVFITGDFSASLQTQADWTVLFVGGIVRFMKRNLTAKGDKVNILSGNRVLVVDIGGKISSMTVIGIGKRLEVTPLYTESPDPFNLGIIDVLDTLGKELKGLYPQEFQLYKTAASIPSQMLQDGIRRGKVEMSGEWIDVNQARINALAKIADELELLYQNEVDGGKGVQHIVVTGGGGGLLLPALRDDILKHKSIHPADDMATINFANLRGGADAFLEWLSEAGYLENV